MKNKETIYNELSGKSVFIINDFSLLSSIGLTFRDYERAVKEFGVVISIAYSWRFNNYKYPGITIPPGYYVKNPSVLKLLTSFPDLGVYVNSRLSNFVFRDSFNIIKGLRGDALIHFSNNRVFPFVADERCVVTMNDLIYLTSKRLSEVPIKTYLIRTTKKFSKFKHVISVSNTTKKELINFGFEGDIETIYQPVPEYFKPLNEPKGTLRKRLNLPLDKILILSVSTNRPGKNLKAVKDTMNVLDSRFKLVRVGVPIGDSITFQHVDDQTLNEIYNACDVLLFPSTEEGFGRPVTEAFKVGLPVVASDIEVMQEVCGNAAILVEPCVSKLKIGIEEVSSNWEEFRNRGISRSRIFEFSIFKDKLKSFYDRIY